MKHKLLTHGTSHGTPLINDSARVTEQLVVTEYQDEAGTYRYTQKTVVAKLPDGSERDLLEVLTNVMNFWEHYMETIGIVPVARNFTYDGNVRARSRAECQPNRLDFEVVQGQRFHQFRPATMKFRVWLFTMAFNLLRHETAGAVYRNGNADRAKRGAQRSKSGLQLGRRAHQGSATHPAAKHDNRDHQNGETHRHAQPPRAADDVPLHAECRGQPNDAEQQPETQCDPLTENDHPAVDLIFPAT